VVVAPGVEDAWPAFAARSPCSPRVTAPPEPPPPPALVSTMLGVPNYFDLKKSK